MNSVQTRREKEILFFLKQEKKRVKKLVFYWPSTLSARQVVAPTSSLRGCHWSTPDSVAGRFWGVFFRDARTFQFFASLSEM